MTTNMQNSLSEEEMNRQLQQKEAAIIQQPIQQAAYSASSESWPPNGYKNIPYKFLPSKGLFYPEGTSIAIRPLTVKEVRHFSTIDENDKLDVLDKLNYIVAESCIFNSNQLSWKNILEFDRLYLILAVRELTFINSPSKLTMKSTCIDKNCNTEHELEIRKDTLRFVNEHGWDPIVSNISLETNSFQFDNGKILMYLPSLGNLQWIRNYVSSHRKQYGSDEGLDQSFLVILPYLVPPTVQITESIMKDREQWFNSISIDQFSIIDNAKSIIENNQNITIQYLCSQCGSEVTAPIKFQQGIRRIFIPMLSNFS